MTQALPTGFLDKSGNDLNLLFAPKTSGTNNTTGFIALNGSDLSAIFQPKTTVPNLPTTGYLLNNGTDLSNIFQVLPPFQITYDGSYNISYNSNSGYYQLSFYPKNNLNGLSQYDGSGIIKFNFNLNINLILVGGGGGGGRNSGNANAASGGGGGGNYLVNNYTIIKDTSYNINVGRGGGGSNNPTLTNGGNTYFYKDNNANLGLLCTGGSKGNDSTNTNPVIGGDGGFYYLNGINTNNGNGGNGGKSYGNFTNGTDGSNSYSYIINGFNYNNNIILQNKFSGGGAGGASALGGRCGSYNSIFGIGGKYNDSNFTVPNGENAPVNWQNYYYFGAGGGGGAPGSTKGGFGGDGILVIYFKYP